MPFRGNAKPYADLTLAVSASRASLATRNVPVTNAVTMDSAPDSNNPSGSATPNQRFTSQAATAEDLLKEQTVGLVHLSDFRKRRAEALDQVSRDATPAASGTSTPSGRESGTAVAFKKKRKKPVKTVGLSFADDEGDTGSKNEARPKVNGDPEQDVLAEEESATRKKRLKPNAAVSFAPKAHTKTALRREAELKESLRREYAQVQEAVRQTEFCLPFVFYDGKDAPGGICRMKKGDHIWLFLERARKMGAEKASKESGGSASSSMKDWARISVDDLMVVRGDLILPHHFEFHYFMLNETKGYKNTPVFPHSASPTAATPRHLLAFSSAGTPEPDTTSAGDSTSYLTTASARQASAKAVAESMLPDNSLEGYNDDPSLTKVVDRRWYELQKHIYPASLWEDFDEKRNYASGSPRKDQLGNSYFASR